MKSLKSLIAVVAIIIGLFALTACSKKITLVGSWVHDDYVYKFNDDKTGSYTAFGTELKFTYKDKGDKVEILYEGNTDSGEYAYKIEDKKFIIEDSFGNDVEYVRK